MVHFDVKDINDLVDNKSKFYNHKPPNINIHYCLEKNNDSDIIFVFLHGLLCGTHSFYPIFDKFKNNGSLLAFDRPGFGLTDRPLPNQESWSKFIFSKKDILFHDLHTESAKETLSEDVLNNISDNHSWINPYSSDYGCILTKDIITDLFDINAKKIYLVGHSLGGVIATQTILTFPFFFSGLILLDSPVLSGVPSGSLISNIFSKIGNFMIKHTVPKAIPYSSAYYGDIKKILTKDQILYHKRIFYCDHWIEGLSEFCKFQLANKLKLKALLSSIHIPIIIISGDKDSIVSKKDSIKLFKLLQERDDKFISKYIEIHNCGHCPMEEYPDVIADILSQISLNGIENVEINK